MLNKKYKILLDKEWLKEQYLKKFLTIKEIANLIGCNYYMVRYYLKKFSIPIRKSYYDRSGPNNPKWKGGKMLIGGYWYILSPKHPFKTKMGYVCEHRLVMEKHLGRYLLKKEVIHHKNGIPTDNKIKNLELITSTGKHFIKKHFNGRNNKGQFKI